jgi:hypothetical protein
MYILSEDLKLKTIDIRNREPLAQGIRKKFIFWTLYVSTYYLHLLFSFFETGSSLLSRQAHLDLVPSLLNAGIASMCHNTWLYLVLLFLVFSGFPPPPKREMNLQNAFILLNLSYSSWPCYKTLNIFSFEYF